MAANWILTKYLQVRKFHRAAAKLIIRKTITSGGLLLGTGLLWAAAGCFKTFTGRETPPQKQPELSNQAGPKSPSVRNAPTGPQNGGPALQVLKAERPQKPPESPPYPPIVFDFKNVINEAHKLAARPFQPPMAVPEFLQQLSYDQWRDIRFRPERALWAGDKLNFTIQFFHTGFLYNYSVKINEVDHRGAYEYRFSPELFDYGKNDFKDKKLASNRGFAGFRIHYPLNTSNYYDEIAVFLGASYFRAVAQNQFYGLSIRGLALDIATHTGEEFPLFKEFWLIRPTCRSREITVMALLDSKSISGAYRFVIKPGKENVFEVNSVLFPRCKVAKLGIAPMTSMFLHGEHSSRYTASDFRPEVHDSDGLYFETDSENIWRPLVNPEKLFINSFQVNGSSFKGFGLLQRDNDFNSYLDLETHYEKRPSLWLAPGKNWPKGHIELVQIPSPNEIQDNIVALWLVNDIPAPGTRFEASYTLKWFSPQPDKMAYGYTTATRKMNVKPEGSVKFILDFQGESLSKLKSTAGITANIDVDKNFTLREYQLTKNEMTGSFR
ncbi:MAG: glucan biosynthesis protein, partial [Victivallaceae bacterium]|nr:glucan biosynthesis protein [Victivallaceae bacterium]